MKKIFLSIVLASLVFSCNQTNKENADNEVITEQSQETNETENTEIKTEKIQTKLKVFTPEKATELLQTKNDTLYVTNFFATWCGPCVKEIPHFVEVIEETKGLPIKFTFINIDEKEDWVEKVEPFTQEKGIQNNTILLDTQNLNTDFFAKNFQKWQGDFIPFTFLRKGDKTEELGGSISKEKLLESINRLK